MENAVTGMNSMARRISPGLTLPPPTNKDDRAWTWYLQVHCRSTSRLQQRWLRSPALYKRWQSNAVFRLTPSISQASQTSQWPQTMVHRPCPWSRHACPSRVQNPCLPRLACYRWHRQQEEPWWQSCALDGGDRGQGAER